MSGTMTSLAIRTRLGELERVIEGGLTTFVAVGRALLEVRDDRLYREGHQTFEVYCRERWGLARATAYRHIEAAEMSRGLDTETQPTSKEQWRELAPLKDQPTKMAEAFNEAVERSNGKPTAEVVREVVAQHTGKMAVHYSSASPDWETPQDLFDLLDAEFGFGLDVCATKETAKCGRYFTEQTDGLAQTWAGICWMNPPYGDAISRWVAKASEAAKQGATVVCLVPARVETNWWWDHCRYGEIRFLRGRLKFGGAETSAPFPSALVIFGPDREQRVIHWERP